MAQLYETRIKKLVSDYRGQSVAFVAIRPNNPKAMASGSLWEDVGNDGVSLGLEDPS